MSYFFEIIDPDSGYVYFENRRIVLDKVHTILKVCGRRLRPRQFKIIRKRGKPSRIKRVMKEFDDVLTPWEDGYVAIYIMGQEYPLKIVCNNIFELDRAFSFVNSQYERQKNLQKSA